MTFDADVELVGEQQTMTGHDPFGCNLGCNGAERGRKKRTLKRERE